MAQHITSYMAQQLVTSNYRNGSPLAAATFDAANGEDNALANVCQKAYDVWLDHTASILQQRFAVEGSLAKEMSIFAIGAIEGAVILSRAKRSPEPLQKITTMLAHWVETQI